MARSRPPVRAQGTCPTATPCPPARGPQPAGRARARAAWRAGLGPAVVFGALAGTLALAPGCSRAVQFGAEVGRISQDSVERLPDGREFNRDTGMLDTATLQLRWPLGGSPGPARGGDGAHWQGGLVWRHEQGRLAYRGLSSFGAPLVSQTRLQRERLSLRLDRRLWPQHAAWAGSSWLGLELATEWTARGIAATPLSAALDEQLTRHELALQGQARWPLGPGGLHLAARGRLARAWSQQLRAEAGGALDAVQLRPRGGQGREWALGLAWAPPGAAWQLELAHAARREQVGASSAMPATAGGLPAGSVRFPGSHHRGQGWHIGAHWRLR